MTIRTQHGSLVWPSKNSAATRRALDYLDADRPTLRFGVCEVPLDADHAELVEVLREVYSLEALARALSRIARFNGNASGFCSVAQHSVLVMTLARVLFPADLSVARLALFHDAHEAITGDCPTPVKRVVGDAWRAFEDRIERALRQVLDLPDDTLALEQVKLADTYAFHLENERWRHGYSVDEVLRTQQPALGQSAVIRDLLEHDRDPKAAEGLFIVAAGALR